jgi:hypothetical protein
MVKEEVVREDVLRTFWVCLAFMTAITSFTSPDPLFPFLQ